LIFTAQIKIFL